jgi:hypothetical protein
VPGWFPLSVPSIAFSQLRRQLDHRLPLVSWTGASFGAKTGLCHDPGISMTVIVGSVSAHSSTTHDKGGNRVLSDLRELASDQQVEADLCLVWAGPAGDAVQRERQLLNGAFFLLVRNRSMMAGAFGRSRPRPRPDAAARSQRR